jgi:hypothetical protein
MTVLLYTAGAVVLVGVLVLAHRIWYRRWRKRRDPFLRAGWVWCPTCHGTGEFHHDLIVPGSRMAPVDACPSCRGVGQIRLDARHHYPLRESDGPTRS